MDLGMVGFNGFVGSDTSSLAPPLLLSPSPPLVSSDPDQQTKQKWYGSGFLKQQRSGTSTTEDDWCRSLKAAKTDDLSASKGMLLPPQQQQQQRGPFLRSNSNAVSTTNSSSSFSSSTSLFCDEQHQHQHQHQQQMMLSFSSPNSQTVTFPNYYHHPPSTFARNSGYGGSGGLNAASASMHGVFTGVRGPFTPSQWMELEHQALIYKYLTENVPIPSNLLLPIRKALDSAGFSSFSGGPLGSSALGWGAFRLGFSNNTDPEPGRCRRTDGKKWRCSRDAVADQKYCERHMNRGRHRSRKPVEGQSGHSVAGQPTTTPKLLPVASSASASVVPGGGASNSLGLSHHHQIKNLHPSATHLSASSSPNRIFLNNDNTGERILSPTIGLRDNTQFPIPKHHNPYEESGRAEFGRVCSDSLLNPFHDTENRSQQRSVRQFMDDWPKNHTDHHRSPISWPNLDLQPDRTQLSISIPVAAAVASDFMSSTSSPVNNEKLALSPLRLSRELESTQMGLGVGSIGNEVNQRQSNLIPISWEASVGGPLGEVLHSTTTSSASVGGGAGDYKNTSALNLMTEGWDISPRLASSPTGVLQKMTFGSLSNSSAGSSPRAENHHKTTTHEVGAATFCNDLLGSTLLKSSSLPAL